ncbi:MAG TPA: YceI family protein [Gaiellales bacterium]|jgi:polyisoprenoid-binding protein YceI|nr:YceI family protein [Gaiellales bacterium]
MFIPAGTYRFGPDNGTLAVNTGRTGAVAKAGHDLLLHVTGWEGTLEIGSDPAPSRLEVRADGGSLKVQQGTGGMQALDEDDKANIEQTIDDEVLRRDQITFRSTHVAPAGDGLRVTGDLTLLGHTAPLALDVVVDDGTITAAGVIRQTDFGMKPYSALFGALKVADEVRVSLAAAWPA